MALDVTITITDNSAAVLDALAAQTVQALSAIGMAGESNAKAKVTEVVYNTPERGYVRTGNLRNRITHEVIESENAVIIGERLEYAPIVETGTSRMRARPFLKPAITDNVSQYKALAEHAYGKT